MTRLSPGEILPSRKLQDYLIKYGSKRAVACTEGQIEAALRDAFAEGILTWADAGSLWSWGNTATYLADHAEEAPA